MTVRGTRSSSQAVWISISHCRKERILRALCERFKIGSCVDQKEAVKSRAPERRERDAGGFKGINLNTPKRTGHKISVEQLIWLASFGQSFFLNSSARSW